MTTMLLDPVDELTRRRLIAGGLATGFLLTGCGTRDPAAPSAPSAGSRSITDDRGEVTLEAVPRRIVTTGEEVTELIVALGLQPVGVGSPRLDAALGGQIFDGYYLTREQLGSPRYVGPDPYNFEAITALTPDLIVHYSDDENVARFERIAPTVVYDVTAPGTWQNALRRLGDGADREQEASAAIDAFDEEHTAAKQALAPVIAEAPRISVIYPNYRGSSDNFVFGEEFALAAVLPALGFDLVGIEQAAVTFPGVGSISLELLGSIDTDTVIALGPVDWTDTPSEPILSSLDAPVLGVVLDANRPSAGPLTSIELLKSYVEVLSTHHGT